MNIDKFNKLVDSAKKIVIIQADNPDGDSLASSLALDTLLANLGKEVSIYCGVDIPTYLRHMPGWDRIVHELPKNFDLSIILDTSSVSLLESLEKSGEINWLKTKPCVIIDHHATEPTINFATDIINEVASSTGEIVFKISEKNAWKIDKQVAEYLASSILFDTLGMTTESVTPKTLLTMSRLLENGVSLAELDDRRRLSNKKSIRLVEYKGRLLQRVSVDVDKRVATIDIPWSEIEKFSYEYNPSMLVLDEMRMIDTVLVAIAFKIYPDGKLTAKIRTNFGIKIADKIAEHFGGGGHEYAAGFKISKANNPEETKLECIKKTTELLDSIKL